MTVEIDDSFKKPGAVPFKWEIRPGVPKLQHHHHKQQNSSPLPKKLSPPALSPPSSHPSFSSRSRHASPVISRSSSIFLTPPPDYLRSGRSFRSAPRARSERWRPDRNQQQPTNRVRGRPEVVSGPAAGCFFNLPSLPMLLLRRGRGKKSNSSKSKRMTTAPVAEEDSYDDSGSEFESFSRWSVSSRRSLSPFMDSPASPYSYSSSYDQFSPRPLVGDADWAGFALF